MSDARPSRRTSGRYRSGAPGPRCPAREAPRRCEGDYRVDLYPDGTVLILRNGIYVGRAYWSGGRLRGWSRALPDGVRHALEGVLTAQQPVSDR